MGQRRGLEIRAATGADAAGLSALLAAGGVAWPATALADRLDAMRSATGTALIAVDWGPPTGLVALHWFASLQAARPIARIDMLLVGEDERRKGLGRLLVKAASQAARSAGCGRIEITAGMDQAELRCFCLATGFSQTGHRLERALRKSAG